MLLAVSTGFEPATITVTRWHAPTTPRDRWQPYGESNPGLHLERVLSCAARRQGHDLVDKWGLEPQPNCLQGSCTPIMLQAHCVVKVEGFEPPVSQFQTGRGRPDSPTPRR